MTPRRNVYGRVVSVSVGVNQSVARRVRNQAIAAAARGIRFDQVLIGGDKSEADCMSILSGIAKSEDVLAVVLQHPLPDHMHPAQIGSAIPDCKAVDTCSAATDVIMNRLDDKLDHRQRTATGV